MNENKYLRVSNHRRALIAAGAAIPALAWAGVARAQTKPPVLIGWLNTGSNKTQRYLLEAFKEGMRALGWQEGANYVLEDRWAEGWEDRVPRLAEELAARKPAVIVTAQSFSTLGAAKAAPTTPIVQAYGVGGVLMERRLVASLARPGGLVTGQVNLAIEVSEKRLELLLECAPSIRRVGFLIDASNAATQTETVKTVERVLARYRIEGRLGEMSGPDDIEPVMARLAKEDVRALVVMPGSFFDINRERIFAVAMKHRWPVAGGGSNFAAAGALLTYGIDAAGSYQRAAYFVDRILKGTKPADLPMEQPTKFEVIVNMKTAKALGITIPQTVLVRTTKVIE